MSSLYEIHMSVDVDTDTDPDHGCINLEWWSPDSTADTETECANAASYCAGILARIAATAADWIGHDRQEHRCPQPRYQLSRDHVLSDCTPRCGVNVFNLIDACEPSVHLTVPISHLDAWTARVRCWLNELTLQGAAA